MSCDNLWNIGSHRAGRGWARVRKVRLGCCLDESSKLSFAMPSVARQPFKAPKGCRRGTGRTSYVALGRLAEATRSRPFFSPAQKNIYFPERCFVSSLSRHFADGTAPRIATFQCVSSRSPLVDIELGYNRFPLALLWQDVAGRVPLMFIVLGACYLLLGMVGSSMISPPPLGSLAQG